MMAELPVSRSGVRPALLWRTAAACIIMMMGAAGHAQSVRPDELVVTANKSSTQPLDLIGNTARITEQPIRLTNHQHIYELGVRAAGTWISRGSGQEHLTAIRSPVLTGPGACGAFLMLEDGIPIRPTGFCNVNQLFEVPTELASSIEVLRGPSNALFGSNGLHGTLNILMPAPGVEQGLDVSLAIGPDEYRRGKINWGGPLAGNPLTAGLVADHYDGFRDDSGYDQQKGYARLAYPLASSELLIGLDFSNLDQETAGFIRGEDAYKDESLRTTNPNPEAFRDADSQRFFTRWIPDADHDWAGSDVRAYLRRSDMEFLQHFLPGQPLEENGQVSGGIMSSLQRPWGEGHSFIVGLDLELADGFLKQTQENEGGGPSRPIGKQYDYDVQSIMAAPYAQAEIRLAAAWALLAGLRVEYLRYDYDNNMLDGETADDGTPCPGGCLFSRPADRTDDFLNVAPNIGLRYRVSESLSTYMTLGRGFRAPQATELYRLQAGQAVADLDTETADSLEVGMHWITETLSVETTAFAMKKRDSIFRDADGFNISNGKSKHYGLELQADMVLESGVYAGLAATWARHTYNFDRNFDRSSDVIVSGNDVDTAPRTLGSARLGIDRGPGLAEIEWVHQGSYYLDAANAHKYPGHDILNARVVWRVTDNWSSVLRVNNIADKLYADRADYAFFNYRYFPAREREVFLEIAYRAF